MITVATLRAFLLALPNKDGNLLVCIPDFTEEGEPGEYDVREAKTMSIQVIDWSESDGTSESRRCVIIE